MYRKYYIGGPWDGLFRSFPDSAETELVAKTKVIKEHYRGFLLGRTDTTEVVVEYAKYVKGETTELPCGTVTVVYYYVGIKE